MRSRNQVCRSIKARAGVSRHNRGDVTSYAEIATGSRPILAALPTRNWQFTRARTQLLHLGAGFSFYRIVWSFIQPT